MLKKNKKFFIASCIVILLPMFAGFLLWDQLPAQVATHFGRNGEADRYSSKLFAVAGIYLFLLAVHILCSVITEFDPKKRNVGSKIYHLISDSNGFAKCSFIPASKTLRRSSVNALAVIAMIGIFAHFGSFNVRISRVAVYPSIFGI